MFNFVGNYSDALAGGEGGGERKKGVDRRLSGVIPRRCERDRFIIVSGIGASFAHR